MNDPGHASADVDSDALRDVEFSQSQIALESLVGKTIAAASVEPTRVAIATSDGMTFFFYGFLGGQRTGEPDKAP